MEKHNGWWFPNGNLATAQAIFHEWDQKGRYVTGLCKQKRVCVQAGGNVGVFAKRLSTYFDTVHTWEPMPDNLECLDKNNMPDNVVLHRGAIGDEIGTVKIASTIPNNCGATQVEKGGDIQLDTIDSLEAEVDLIWLDIEGFEYKALLGAMKTIEEYNPVIVIENKGLMPEFGGDLNGSKEFVDWMNSIGYKRKRRMMRDDIYTR